MKHICVITTGGTIDSSAVGGSLSVQKAVSPGLVGLLDKVIDSRASHGIISPLNKNSEDFSLHDIEAIAATIDARAKAGDRLFIITHGSDTLHFTAAALGFIFGGRDIVICLVAAFRPLFKAGSDGPDTLAAAVDLLLADSTAPSVWVALKEDLDASPVAIADWRDVKPLAFDSRGMERLHRPPLIPLPAMALGYTGLGGKGRHVRYIPAYVGLNSDVLENLAKDADILVIGAYHSGTVPSGDTPQSGVTAFMSTHPDLLVLLSGHPGGEEDYASTGRFEAAGGILVRHLLPHQAYILACLLRAQADDMAAIRRSFLAISRPGDDAA